MLPILIPVLVFFGMIVIVLREIVVGTVIDVDLIVPPAAAPAMVAPPRSSYRHARRKRKGSCSDIAVRIDGVRRIGRVRPSSIHHGRIIRWDVNYLRACRLDDNHLRLLLDNDLLFLCILEVPRFLRLPSETLGGFHDVLLLVQEGVAEFLGPFDLFVHHQKDVGKL